MMKKWMKKAAAFLCILSLLAGAAGCGKDFTVVLTTGLKKNEVFRIEKMSCTLPELMVYLTNLQNQYESVYGEEIWAAKAEGTSLEEEAREQVLAELAQVKTMALLAQEKEVTLDEKEEQRVSAAAAEYFGSLNETEIETLGVDQELIAQMYREYVLAGKVYRQIVENVNPEISDDEARTITVLAIRMEDGQKAQDVCRQAKEEGADFEALADTYSEDTTVSYSFGKGEVEEAIETTAFNLGKDEVSDVIAAQDGYYILKCISTFDEAQTQLNKEKIANQRRNEAFNQEYDSFVNSLVRRLNEELWDSVTMIRDENVTTNSFFTVYNKYFQNA